MYLPINFTESDMTTQFQRADEERKEQNSDDLENPFSRPSPGVEEANHGTVLGEDERQCLHDEVTDILRNLDRKRGTLLLDGP